MPAAKEFTIAAQSCSVQDDNNRKVDIDATPKQTFTQTNYGLLRNSQQIATGGGTALDTGSLTTPGRLRIHNRDDTNFLNITLVLKIAPGEHTGFIPLDSTSGLTGIADTAAVNIDYDLIEA